MRGIGRRARPIGYESVSPEGYIKVRVPSAKRWEYRHRLAMEHKLGRKLLPCEVVHHINGNKQDNREENLTLCASEAEHKHIHHGKPIEIECKHCGRSFAVAQSIYRNRVKFNGTPPTYCNAKCQQADLRGKPFSGKPGHPKGGYREERRDLSAIANC